MMLAIRIQFTCAENLSLIYVVSIAPSIRDTYQIVTLNRDNRQDWTIVKKYGRKTNLLQIKSFLNNISVNDYKYLLKAVMQILKYIFFSGVCH